MSLCLTTKANELDFHENDCTGETHLFKGFALIFILTTYDYAYVPYFLIVRHFLIITDRTATGQTACQDLHYPREFLYQSHSVVMPNQGKCKFL